MLAKSALITIIIYTIIIGRVFVAAIIAPNRHHSPTIWTIYHRLSGSSPMVINPMVTIIALEHYNRNFKYTCSSIHMMLCTHLRFGLMYIFAKPFFFRRSLFVCVYRLTGVRGTLPIRAAGFFFLVTFFCTPWLIIVARGFPGQAIWAIFNRHQV